MTRQPIGTVVLAAGGATRFGRPKQLAVMGGMSLVVRATRAALAADLGPVLVVTGSAGEDVSAALRAEPIVLVPNPDWRDGMGGSIGSGVRALRRHCPNADAVIVVACDQPAVTGEHLRLLAATFRASGRPIVASTYGGVAGVPALFARERFESLEALAGDRGARQLLAEADQFAAVPLPGGELDVDRPEDMDSWLARGEKPMR